MKRYVNVPVNLSLAQAFTAKHHRHSAPLRRHKFSIGLIEAPSSHLLGLVTVDNCSGGTWSAMDDRLEVRRLFVSSEAPENASSMLLGFAKRAVFAMGYSILVTYTQPHESGASLRAAGFSISKRGKMEYNGFGGIMGGLIRWEALDRPPTACERKFTDDVLAGVEEFQWRCEDWFAEELD